MFFSSAYFWRGYFPFFPAHISLGLFKISLPSCSNFTRSLFSPQCSGMLCNLEGREGPLPRFPVLFPFSFCVGPPCHLNAPEMDLFNVLLFTLSPHLNFIFGRHPRFPSPECFASPAPPPLSPHPPPPYQYRSRPAPFLAASNESGFLTTHCPACLCILPSSLPPPLLKVPLSPSYERWMTPHPPHRVFLCTFFSPSNELFSLSIRSLRSTPTIAHSGSL